MRGQDLLSLADHDAAELIRALERAQDLARAWGERRMPQSLDGRRLGLIVDDTGWRNTTAFDLGVQAMGGVCVHAPIALGGGREALPDLAGYLDNWLDAVIVRTPNLSDMRELAQAAAAPVINARTRTNHPCETLGDLAFAMAQRGSIEGLKVAVAAPGGNILGSWVEAAATLPIEVVQVYPSRWHVAAAERTSGFRVSEDVGDLTAADMIVTDCWPTDADQIGLAPYQITAALLEASEALFVPCPPVTRGQEVSEDAMLHPNCRAREAKAFLLHAQNAVLEAILADRG
ncbi:MAG: ornithine carbamoyltransferase [Phenylobacterium sp.]